MPSLGELYGWSDATDETAKIPEPPKGAGLFRTAADLGIKGAQGAVDLGQSVVGLANLATGGLAGKGMRAVGYDPEATNKILGEGLSDAQKASDAKVQQAQGFTDTVMASLENPRSIAGSIAESLPSMLAAGGVAGAAAKSIAVKAAAPFGGLGTEAGKAAAQAAIESAAGKLAWLAHGSEGALTAGQIADQGQAAGSDFGTYAPAALAAGAGTAAIGRLAGKIAGDAETSLFTGAQGIGIHGSLPARIAKGIASEGILEEMPQSAQEQMFTNIATGKPAGEGVAQAAASGLVTGGAMGGAMGAMQRRNHAAEIEAVKARYAPDMEAATRLKDAGEPEAASVLSKSVDKKIGKESAAIELGAMADVMPDDQFHQDPSFQQHYEDLRLNGGKPAESAARAAMIAGFKQIGADAGMPEKAIDAAINAANGKPIEDVPAFLDKFTKAAKSKGLASDQADGIAGAIEAARDTALHAVSRGLYGTAAEEDSSNATLDKMRRQAEQDLSAQRDFSREPIAQQPQPVESPSDLPATQPGVVAETPLDVAAHAAATSPLNDLPEPTPAQKEAGNYAKGHIKLHGLDISIENPRGSTRSGTSQDGTTWETPMNAHYGYFLGTIGNDKDHVDTFVGPNPDSTKVFVVDQVHKDGTFDEHKVMLGFDSLEQADANYHSNYEPGWTGRGAITEMPIDQFKTWVKDGPKNTPLGNIKGAANVGAGAQTSPVAAANGGQLGADAAGGNDVRGSVPADAARPGDDAARGVLANGQPDLPVRAAQPEQPGALTNKGTNVKNAAPGTAAQAQAQAAQAPAPAGSDANPVMGNPATAGAGELEAARVAQAQRDAHAKSAEKAAKKAKDTGPGMFDEPAKPEDATTAQAKADRLTDAGEELIRNRRGKLKGLAWDDVSAMNDTLKVAQVVKSNVWPRPDYTKMVEDGASAWKAAALKAVYDKLAAAPVTRMTPTDADLRAYIETMHKIRDLLSAELDRVAALPDGGELWKNLNQANVFGKVFPLPSDARAVYGRPSPFDRTSEQGKENNKRALLIGGNSAVQALQFSYKITSKIKDLLAEGFPAKQEAWQKSWEVRATEVRDNDVPEGERTGEPQKRFFVYEKGSRTRLAKGNQDGGYATQEQAEAFARSLTARKREALPPSRGLDLASVKRTGPDWRAGKNVTAEQVMQHFGFRGVNLGEYVKAKQDLAQLHLNHVFDAFSDLADLLGVPPKAMSLNGTLGVAIGAQGSGKALAHFAPGVNEINITRDSGAGALAHEFGHAVDHYFATQHGRAAAMSKRPYLSAAVDGMRDPGGVRPEVIEAMKTVMNTINSRPMTEEEARKYMDDQRARNQKYLGRWVVEFKGNRGADAAALDAAAEKLKRGEVGETTGAGLESNIAEFLRAANIRPNNHLATNAVMVAYRLRDLADEASFLKNHIPQLDTNYSKASQALDAKKSAGNEYWSTPWEKFARAFETFAMDALKDRERESLYLSGLVDSQGWRDWAESTGNAMPFPEGDERLAMQQAFQMLADTIQTKEDDQGNVAMFARDGAGTKSATQLERVKAWTDELSNGWKNGPAIRVVQSVKDLPIEAPDDVRGVYVYPGTVYIIADRATSKKDVGKVLIHEAIAHHGLREMLGRDGWDKFMDQIQLGLASGNKPLNKIRDELRTIYVGEDGKPNLSPRQEADEIAARVAEDCVDKKTGEFKPGFGFMKEVYAKIVQFLRDHGFDVSFTRIELQGMLVAAQRNLEVGQRTAGQGQAVVATARETAPTAMRDPSAWAVTREASTFDEARTAAKAFQGKALVNRASEMEATVSRNTLDKMLSAKAVMKSESPASHSFAVANLDQLFERAVLGWTKPDTTGDPNIVAIHRFFAPVLRKGKAQLVKMTIKETARSDQSNPLYTVESVEFDENSPAAQWVDSTVQSDGIDPTSIRSAGEVRSLAERVERFNSSGEADAPAASRAPLQPQQASMSPPAKARELANDLFATHKTFNWWNNTVGTPYQKAAQDKDFKKVFDATQDYIQDVSRIANDAADRARDLLPRMEHFSDVIKHTKKADVNAIAKPIFQGTLADKRVYRTEELKRVFGLTDKQVDLYKQFRQATDKSLDDLTTTTISKLVRAAGIPEFMFQSELELGDHAAIAAAAKEWAKQDEKMAGLAEQVGEISSRANQLKGEAYAPLMRFGQYAVSLRDPKTNELQEFHLFESERKANAKARELALKGKIEQTVMSKDDHLLLKGVSPESIELFGDILEKAGMLDSKDEMFQAFLRKAVDQRSAMKRMIHRVGYAGFNQDVRRVLSTFITSNARLASKNLHYSNMLEAAENVPKSKGDVRDEAARLVHYVQNPVEEASMIRGLLFVNFIGGSVASAITNMTQTLTMTLPYLSQFSTPSRAAVIVAKAVSMASGDIKDQQLASDLARAEQSGVVSPQEIHNLNAESMATFGSNPLVQRAMFVWGSLFSMAEQFNRKAAFIAAYELARENGEADAYEFAKKAVIETQGIYNKGNRPNWARGAVGATMLTFKQFSISYLEFLSRLPKREKALALAVLMLSAGAEGLPFADDIDDLIDTIAQRLGYSFNSKAKKRQFLGETLGEGASDFILKGVSSVPGMPIDIAGRMGMANLVPGTSMLRKDIRDHMRDVLEFAGPVGGVVQNATRGEFRPTAWQNFAKGFDMFQTGMYRDNAGRKVIDVDAVDALSKAIGFQPADVAKHSLAARLVTQDINLAKVVESEIVNSMAQARFEGDKEMSLSARENLADWNRKNPESQIAIKPSQIESKVKEMRKTHDARIIQSSPKELRGGLKDRLN